MRLVGKELIYNGPKDLKNYVLIGNISFDDSDEVINHIMNKYKNLIKSNFESGHSHRVCPSEKDEKKLTPSKIDFLS